MVIVGTYDVRLEEDLGLDQTHPTLDALRIVNVVFRGNGTRMLELRVNKVTGAAQDFQHSKIQDQRQNGV